MGGFFLPHRGREFAIFLFLEGFFRRREGILGSGGQNPSKNDPPGGPPRGEFREILEAGGLPPFLPPEGNSLVRMRGRSNRAGLGVVARRFLSNDHQISFNATTSVWNTKNVLLYCLVIVSEN